MLALLVPGVGMGGGSASPLVSAVISAAVQFAQVQDSTARLPGVQPGAAQLAAVQDQSPEFSQR